MSPHSMEALDFDNPELPDRRSLGQFVAEECTWERIVTLPHIVVDSNVTSQLVTDKAVELTLICDLYWVPTQSGNIYIPKWRLILHLKERAECLEVRPIHSPVDDDVLSFRVSLKEGLSPSGAAETFETLSFPIHERMSASGRLDLPNAEDMLRYLLFKGFYEYPKEPEPWHDHFYWCNMALQLFLAHGWLLPGIRVAEGPFALRDALHVILDADIWQS
ncbi:hypothetical protein CALVIDRAFT_530143 [Calocera viscosa TUFC12733]|uniref:Uncharacterized protein n=1 Tax=Calocera viscosa (strain TUFC12733) TaxID=1330018 RepID=A0A167ICB7_CALVF|nr:hypothetical protein CALVIDRAFT_530143 [Calocera viscosa TUFC12733]